MIPAMQSVLSDSRGPKARVGSPYNAPVMLTQPLGVVINEGDNFTLSVTASCVGSMTYQWYKNSVAVGGATSASYAVTGGGAANNGTYHCVVTGPGGTITSVPASVTTRVYGVVTTGTGNAGLSFTAKTAYAAGLLTVSATNPGGTTALSVSVVSGNVAIVLGTSSGTITSTAAQVKAAILAHAPAAALITPAFLPTFTGTSAMVVFSVTLALP